MIRINESDTSVLQRTSISPRIHVRKCALDVNFAKSLRHKKAVHMHVCESGFDIREINATGCDEVYNEHDTYSHIFLICQGSASLWSAGRGLIWVGGLVVYSTRQHKRIWQLRMSGRDLFSEI